MAKGGWRWDDNNYGRNNDGIWLSQNGDEDDGNINDKMGTTNHKQKMITNHAPPPPTCVRAVSSCCYVAAHLLNKLLRTIFHKMADEQFNAVRAATFSKRNAPHLTLLPAPVFRQVNERVPFRTRRGSAKPIHDPSHKISLCGARGSTNAATNFHTTADEQ